MLISDGYREQQRELHERPDYGVASVGFAPAVAALIRELGARSVTDYGAGKQRLHGALSDLGVTVDYRPYDPAFPEYGPARDADLVCCIDVLEHIEPECLDAVLGDLARITRVAGLFTIHTGPARKVLADGRNAHLIQQSEAWWIDKLRPLFRVTRRADTGGGFAVVVAPCSGVESDHNDAAGTAIP